MKEIKIFAIGLFLSLTAFAVYALQEIPIPLAVRTAGSVTSSDMYTRDAGSGPKDVGVTVNSYVSSVVGTVTLTFKVQGKTPQGEYYDAAVLTGVVPVAGTVNTLTLRPGINHVAGASISLPLPPVFRVISTTTDTGTATYSIGVNRITN